MKMTKMSTIRKPSFHDHISGSRAGCSIYIYIRWIRKRIATSVVAQPQETTSLTASTMTADSKTNGFPDGYFIIRSAATKRLLDVTYDEIEDGTELLLFPEKEKSLVESRR